MANTVATSPYYQAWVQSNEALISPMITALAENDLTTIGAPVSYTHLRAHETVLDLVCRLLLEKKKTTIPNRKKTQNSTHDKKKQSHTIQSTSYE
ncbi:diphosphomevalonate decarboxylase [Lactobacillus rhamnosus GG] [Lacticaseibacillus rhamnosus]|nr:diphosphomevalonate decarboxylase [Lactobacillus rhamnosus GG] [Lacticaseibacillus rhamnosus]